MSETVTTNKTSFLRSPWVWAALLGIVGVPLMRPLFRHPPEPPPVLATLPPFELINSAGVPSGSKELAGHVYVTGFIFTRCDTLCPRLAESMHKLQETFRRAKLSSRLLSITVDPDYDTPEKLQGFARLHQADLSRWTFLTGEPAKVKAVIKDVFMNSVGPIEHEGQRVSIAHSGSLFLVDDLGRFRGSYSMEREGREEIFHRTLAILSEQQHRTAEAAKHSESLSKQNNS